MTSTPHLRVTQRELLLHRLMKLELLHMQRQILLANLLIFTQFKVIHKPKSTILFSPVACFFFFSFLMCCVQLSSIRHFHRNFLRANQSTLSFPSCQGNERWLHCFCSAKGVENLRNVQGGAGLITWLEQHGKKIC